jgi:hypothetical protein
MVHPVYERVIPDDKWQGGGGGVAVPTSVIVRCGDEVEVYTEFFFAELFFGEDDIQSVRSFAAWWRPVSVAGEPGGGGAGGGGSGGSGENNNNNHDSWRVVTAYRAESSWSQGGGEFTGATGTPGCGNANVQSLAHSVGLSPLSTEEEACVLTVLAGMRPGPRSSARFAWNRFPSDGDDSLLDDELVFGHTSSPCGGVRWLAPEMSGDMLDNIESGLLRLRLVWLNPTPPPPPTFVGAQHMRWPKPVEGECDDVLKYLPLWDGN